MNLRRLRWMIQALLKRYRNLAFLTLAAVLVSLLALRYSEPGEVRKNFLNLVSSARYSEGLVGTPKTFNPLFVSSDSERDISRLLFRGLTKADLAGNVTGDLAESWETSSSGQVYLFHLKTGLKFQNGDPITSADVALTYELAKNQETGSHFNQTFQNLEISVVSDSDILFRLRDPYTPFLSITDLGILPKKIVEKIDPKNLRLDKFGLDPIGSTEFRLISYSQDEVKLVRNGQEFIFRFYQTTSDLLTALKMGEVKAAGFSEPVNFSGWNNLQQFSSPLYRRFVGIFYNLRQGITADRGVRQGLSYSLDKKKLLDTLGGSLEESYGPIPPISWAKAESLKKYDYKPDLAKSSFEKAGWVGGPVRQKDSKSADIVLSFIDTEQFRILSAEIAKQWAQTGIRAILNPLSPLSFKTKVIDGKDFQAAIFTQEVGIDPDQYVLWHSTQIESTNITGLKLPKLDKSLEDGRQILEKSDRLGKYADFQRFLLDEAPLTFLYYPKYTYLVTTKVDGIELMPLGIPGDRLANISNWKLKRTIL